MQELFARREMTRKDAMATDDENREPQKRTRTEYSPVDLPPTKTRKDAKATDDENREPQKRTRTEDSPEDLPPTKRHPLSEMNTTVST